MLGKISPASTLIEVAMTVCTAMAHAGYELVVVGGSAATIYAPEAYQSRDIDLVITLSGTEGPEVMRSLGFERSGQTYIHPVSPYTIDFLPGPVQVADEIISRFTRIRHDGYWVDVIPVDAILQDRMLAVVFWNDFASLPVIRAILKSHPTCQQSFRAWVTEHFRDQAMLASILQQLELNPSGES